MKLTVAAACRCLLVRMCPQTSMMEKKRRRTLASMSKAAMTASDPNHWAWETANDDAEKLLRRERKAAAREAYWEAYARAVSEHNARVVRKRAKVFHEAAALAVAWRQCREAKEAAIEAERECERRAMAAAAAVAQEMTDRKSRGSPA